jgi:hypothetical protein
MSILKTATDCWRQAAEVENQAAQINDQHLKAVYLRIAQQWSVLARNYEFADAAEHFLLDAKRTSGELVHLRSSLGCREAEQSQKPHSDRCCLRLVPDEPPAQSGAVAA